MYTFIKLGNLIIPKSQVKHISIEQDISMTNTIDRDIIVEYHGFIFTVTYQKNNDKIETFKIHTKNRNVMRLIMERGKVESKYEYIGCENKESNYEWFKEQMKYLESLAVEKFRGQVFIEL